MMMITNNETINTKKIFYNEMVDNETIDTGRLMEKNTISCMIKNFVLLIMFFYNLIINFFYLSSIF